MNIRFPGYGAMLCICGGGAPPPLSPSSGRGGAHRERPTSPLHQHRHPPPLVCFLQYLSISTTTHVERAAKYVAHAQIRGAGRLYHLSAHFGSGQWRKERERRKTKWPPRSPAGSVTDSSSDWNTPSVMNARIPRKPLIPVVAVKPFLAGEPSSCRSVLFSSHHPFGPLAISSDAMRNPSTMSMRLDEGDRVPIATRPPPPRLAPLTQ